MTMKNVENEILILDTSLDSQLGATGLSYAEKQHLDSLKYHRQHALEESKRSHEDLEFQLMELEAKYESELEDIQNRLIREQDKLLNAFKQRQANLVDYDQQQTMMLMAVKAQTECLESERQKLIDQFKKVNLYTELWVSVKEVDGGLLETFKIEFNKIDIKNYVCCWCG